MLPGHIVYFDPGGSHAHTHAGTNRTAFTNGDTPTCDDAHPSAAVPDRHADADGNADKPFARTNTGGYAGAYGECNCAVTKRGDKRTHRGEATADQAASDLAGGSKRQLRSRLSRCLYSLTPTRPKLRQGCAIEAISSFAAGPARL